ncbi:MAG: tyrosine-protein phosphatase [Bacilli bacterium]|nr:tyrosine-protein phosphatase [Bacilli bacterium]
MKKIDLTFQKNTRDLGGSKTKDGRTVKMGRLIRSGHLQKVSDQDIKILLSMGLTDIIDFRREEEYLYKGDYPLEGVKIHNFPALTDDLSKRHPPEWYEAQTGDFNLLVQLSKKGFDAKDWMKHTYMDLVDSELGIDAYQKFFALLQSKDDGVFLWHCSQGKDRAGVAAYLIERALGVSHEDAMEDYMLTQPAMELKISELTPTIKRYCGGNDVEEGLRNLRDVFSVNEEYIMAALNRINEKYGGLENYLTNVLKADIKRLKALYLD